MFCGYVPKNVGPPISFLNRADTSMPPSHPSPLLKIPCHISAQLSGLWQNILYSLPIGCQNPFSSVPPWTPIMILPGSGDNRPASDLAIWYCCSSEKRWKNAPVNIPDIRPRRGFNEVISLSSGNRSGGTEADVSRGGAVWRNFGSNTLPSTKGTGKV